MDFLRVIGKLILTLIWESRGPTITQSILEGNIEFILPGLKLAAMDSDRGRRWVRRVQRKQSHTPCSHPTLLSVSRSPSLPPLSSLPPFLSFFSLFCQLTIKGKIFFNHIGQPDGQMEKQKQTLTPYLATRIGQSVMDRNP